MYGTWHLPFQSIGLDVDDSIHGLGPCTARIDISFATSGLPTPDPLLPAYSAMFFAVVCLESGVATRI